MKNNLKFFKSKKLLAVDDFFNEVLYNKKFGYYTTKYPFGQKGDFITSPKISNLFSEMISVWLVSAWEILGKPRKINIIELGPGEGTLTEALLTVSKKFPKFNSAKRIYLYEISNYLRNVQKKNIQKNQVKWIKDFKEINGGPVIFFGNEFFDAIPIKQFAREKNLFFEKYYSLDKRKKINEVYKKTSTKYISKIKKFKALKKLSFIEYPELGLNELKKTIKVISKCGGGLLLIDYGYLKPKNVNTLQSIIKHKKNKLLDNLGRADITSLVNFKLLNEYFIKNNLKVKKIVTQKFFLEKMGIIQRADNISKNMNFSEQADLYLRLKRLLDKKLMGDLFKVIFTYNFKKDNFFGFE